MMPLPYSNKWWPVAVLRFREHILASTESTEHVALQTALLYICDGVPVPSVSAAAKAADCSRSTLWRQWRKVSHASAYRLEDFVDWVVRERAEHLRQLGLDRLEAAFLIGVDESTLARISRRLRRLGAQPPVITLWN